uniref:mRNA (guanine-N(7))-methyltransferase n=1 Tax=viral metagenome TaxID=1070528 RepID=A0A6C0CQY9_9ZZZZ
MIEETEQSDTMLLKIRQFHTVVKRDIINNAYSHIMYYIPNAPTVLIDLACGRGGDLHKCFDANYETVVGVDAHENSIIEARERYMASYQSKTKPKQRAIPYHVHFFNYNIKTQSDNIVRSVHQALQTRYSEMNPLRRHAPNANTGQADTVIMNFALNYFFETPDTLDTLIRTVSVLLKPGGVFTGVALDGKRVNEIITQNRTQDIYKIKLTDQKQIQEVYGNGYIFQFTQKSKTTQHYFEFIGEIEEYFIDIPELIRVCDKHKLQLMHTSYLVDNLDDHNDVFYVDFVFSFMKTLQGHELPQQLNVQPQPLQPVSSIMVQRPENKRIEHSNRVLKYFPQTSDRDVNYLDIDMTSESLYSSSRIEGGLFLIKTIQHYYTKPMTTLLDGTANIGTDTIALALAFPTCQITAIENEVTNSAVLEHNINVYNLSNVTILKDNTLHVLNTQGHLNYNVIYIDAPWGGTEYKQHDQMSLFLSSDIEKLEIAHLYVKYRSRADMFIFKVPINYNFDAFYTTIHSFREQTFSLPFKIHNKVKFHLLIVKQHI